MTAAMTTQILLSGLKLIALDGDLATAEPKTLRYRVLNAARVARGRRRRCSKIAANWPWAEAIARPWQRISALPRLRLTCANLSLRPVKTYPGPVEPCGTSPASRRTVIPAQ